MFQLNRIPLLPIAIGVGSGMMTVTLFLVVVFVTMRHSDAKVPPVVAPVAAQATVGPPIVHATVAPPVVVNDTPPVEMTLAAFYVQRPPSARVRVDKVRCESVDGDSVHVVFLCDSPFAVFNSMVSKTNPVVADLYEIIKDGAEHPMFLQMGVKDGQLDLQAILSR